eukprot:scaffold60_cov382-Prasinococcus_capsulatus_cf.AAC.7
MGSNLSRERAEELVLKDFVSGALDSGTEAGDDKDCPSEKQKGFTCHARFSHYVHPHGDQGGDFLAVDVTVDNEPCGIHEEERILVQILNPDALERDFESKTRYLDLPNKDAGAPVALSPTSLLRLLEKDTVQLKVSMSEYLEELAGWDSLLRQDHSSLVGAEGVMREVGDELEARSIRKLNSVGGSCSAGDGTVHTHVPHQSGSPSAQDMACEMVSKSPLALRLLELLAPDALKSAYSTQSDLEAITAAGSSRESSAFALQLLATGRWGSAKDMDPLTATYQDEQYVKRKASSDADFFPSPDPYSTSKPERTKLAVAAHANILPVFTVLRSRAALYLCSPWVTDSLKSMLQVHPHPFGSDLEQLFLCYQVFAALAFCHENGVIHGAISPSCLMMQEGLKWVWLTGFGVADEKSGSLITAQGHALDQDSVDDQSGARCAARLPGSGPVKVPSGGVDSDKHGEAALSDMDKEGNGLRGLLSAWRSGALSNLDYLLALNALAGRRYGDRAFHPVVPWVIDMTRDPEECSEHGGWRDLCKTKWRLTKGDEQLDMTYNSSETPHHISDELLSELSVCIYSARRLPLAVLKRIVRANYEPNEYPATMERLYQWTPDECIPEFYTTTSIFKSVHREMSDLGVPPWAQSLEDFVAKHRQALEGEHVSNSLHEWIDLTFGYKLSGEAAVEAKNVGLPLSSGQYMHGRGRCQLFTLPHPRRSSVQILPMLAREADLSRVGGSMLVSPLQAAMPASNMTSGDGVSSAFLVGQNDGGGIRGDEPIHLPIQGGCDRFVGQLASLEQYHTFMEHTAHLNPAYTEPCQKVGCSPQPERSRPAPPHSVDMVAACCILCELYTGQPLLTGKHSSTETLLDRASLSARLRLPSPIRSVVERLLDTGNARYPSAREILQSTLFPASMKKAYEFLAPFQALPSMAQKAQHLMFYLELAQRMPSDSLELCAPYCLACVEKCTLSQVGGMLGSADVGDDGNAMLDTQSAVSIILVFVQGLTSAQAERAVLPFLVRVLQGQALVRSDFRLAVTSAAFLHEVRSALGMRAYMEEIHPAVLASLRHTTKDVSEVASQSIRSCSFALPVTLKQTAFPLMRSLGRESSKYVIQTLVGLCVQYGEQLSVQHIIPSLRKVLRRFTNVKDAANQETSQEFDPRFESPLPRTPVVLDSLAIIEALLVILPKDSVVRELMVAPNSEILDVCFRPASVTPPPIRMAATRVVGWMCNVVDMAYVRAHVLPELAPLCAFAFPTDDDELESRDDDLAKTQAAARQVACILHSELVKVCDEQTMRASLARQHWEMIEREALMHFNDGTKEGSVQSASQSRALLRMRTRNKAILNSGPGARKKSENLSFDATGAAEWLLLEGVGWSSPPVPRSSRSFAVAEDTKVADDGPVLGLAPDASPWFWIPPTPEDSTQAMPGNLEGDRQQLQWDFNAQTLHSWRAHSGSVRDIEVSSDENTLLSCGGSTRLGGTVRCWNLMECACFTEYQGHKEPVNCVGLLNDNVAVSSDSTVHLWRVDSAECMFRFQESAHGYLGTATAPSIARAGEGSPAYTSICQMGHGGILLAGTTEASVRMMDTNAMRSLALWKCFSPRTVAANDPLASAVSSLHVGQAGQTGSLLSVGLVSGHISLIEARGGSLIASWKAHDATVTKMHLYDDRYLLTSSLDRTLCLWDIRQEGNGLVRTWKGSKEGISSFSVYQRTAIVTGGSFVALCDMNHKRYASRCVALG